MTLTGVRPGAVAVLAAMALLGAACTEETGTSETGSGAEDVLGAEDVASGESIRIGFVSDGASAVSDNTVEIDVAEATVAYLNERRAGLAGRPIELVTCTTEAEPAKATDCGNQMVEAGVPAVLIGSSAVLEGVWEPLHDAGIPTFFTGASSPNVVDDTESTFLISDGIAGIIDVPIDAALDADLDRVTVVVVDVPATVAVFEGENTERFADAGLDLEVIRVPYGTADVTPQLQDAVSGDAGLVHIVGNDTFCISAFQALHALAFDGPITVIPQCLSDATREAVVLEQLEGVLVGSPVPAGVEDETTELFRTVVETYGSGIDTSRTTAHSAFVLTAAFREALDGITDVTAANVIATAKAMPDRELPGGGGLHFRCDGTAGTQPADCVRGTLLATLGPDGLPTSYEPTSSDPIGD